MGEKGLTLVELLIASAILAFAIAGTFAVFTNCLFLNSSNSNLAVASSHAQFVMESLRNSNFTGIRDNIAGGQWNYSFAGVSSLGLDPLKGETINTTCGSLNGTLPVNVTVGWLDRLERPRNVSFETLLGE